MYAKRTTLQWSHVDLLHLEGVNKDQKEDSFWFLRITQL